MVKNNKKPDVIKNEVFGEDNYEKNEKNQGVDEER